MKINWTYIQENFDTVGHIVEAAVMALIGAGLFALGGGAWTLGLVLGGLFAVGHFHGREKRDYETKVKMKPPHLAGYLIWRWKYDNLTDFLPVLGAFIVLCIVASWSGWLPW